MFVNVVGALSPFVEVVSPLWVVAFFPYMILFFQVVVTLNLVLVTQIFLDLVLHVLDLA